MDQLKISNLSFKYPDSETEAVSNINLSISRGQFIVLCGKSGSGKSTLLRLLKPELSPVGNVEGEIFLYEKPVSSLSPYDTSAKIGFIRQNTEYQVVTHNVRSELAFGLENLNTDNNSVTRLIAETSSFFGFSGMLDRRTDELSGGEKQLLCLASVCAMRPEIIILDEPASQLDPVSVEKLYSILTRLNKDFGVTVIISEHRLENLIPIADRVISLDDGRVVFDDSPRELMNISPDSGFLYNILPIHMRLSSKFGLNPDGVSLQSVKNSLENSLKTPVRHVSWESNRSSSEGRVAIEIRHLYHTYDKENYILKDLNLKVRKNIVFGLMGENGSGKTTLIKILTGIIQRYKGKILLDGKVYSSKDESLYNLFSSLPQKCEALFAGPTVRDDLMSVLKYTDLSKSEKENIIESNARFFGIENLLDSHPYDISGGEMQKSALCMVMLKDAPLLFLDEPTKGMDNIFKNELSEKLKQLTEKGITVFMVCHDTEFLAKTADECAMLFDGRIISQCDTIEFFSSSFFYRTCASRLTEGIAQGIITEKMAVELWERNH